MNFWIWFRGWMGRQRMAAQAKPAPQAPTTSPTILPPHPGPTGTPDIRPIAWGAKVSLEFRLRVIAICKDLGFPADWLMAIMAFETGRTFRPDTANLAGSGALGLIQFMPQTAFLLGTSSEALAAMSPVQQLDFVLKYFLPRKGRIHNIQDAYMAVLWPGAVGQTEDYVLFDRRNLNHPKQYIQNRGLDFNVDGLITKYEASRRVEIELVEGIKPGNVA